MTLQLLLEHIGVAVAATTRVLAARGKRIDLFGIALHQLGIRETAATAIAEIGNPPAHGQLINSPTHH